MQLPNETISAIQAFALKNWQPFSRWLDARAERLEKEDAASAPGEDARRRNAEADEARDRESAAFRAYQADPSPENLGVLQAAQMAHRIAHAKRATLYSNSAQKAQAKRLGDAAERAKVAEHVSLFGRPAREDRPAVTGVMELFLQYDGPIFHVRGESPLVVPISRGMPSNVPPAPPSPLQSVASLDGKFLQFGAAPSCTIDELAAIVSLAHAAEAAAE